MILEDETFKEFGYYPKDLKSKSHKKILAKCDQCGKIRLIGFYQYRKLCSGCVKKRENLSEEIIEKRRKPKIGKHPSKEIREKNR